MKPLRLLSSDVGKYEEGFDVGGGVDKVEMDGAGDRDGKDGDDLVGVRIRFRAETDDSGSRGIRGRPERSCAGHESINSKGTAISHSKCQNNIRLKIHVAPAFLHRLHG